MWYVAVVFISIGLGMVVFSHAWEDIFPAQTLQGRLNFYKFCRAHKIKTPDHPIYGQVDINNSYALGEEVK